MASPNKGYKRSWRTLLLNKRYQLRFTLFMVGISAVLMTVLGVWVMKEANDATTVAKNSIVGDVCPKIPVLNDQATDDDAAVPMKLDGDAAGSGGAAAAPAPAPEPAAAPPAPAPAPSAVDPKDVAKHNAMDDVNAVKKLWCADNACTPNRAEPLQIKVAECNGVVKHKLKDPAAVDALRKALIPVVKCEGGGTFSVADAVEPEHHVKVQIDESSMTLTPTLPSIPADYTDRVVSHWTCEMRQLGSIADLERGRLRILWVLIATGLALM